MDLFLLPNKEILMNNYIISILPICLALSNCATGAPDQIVTSVQNGYQIETIASQYAYPTGIRIKPVENGLQITGRVTHHVHQAIRIRGHLEIELLDTQGQIIKQITVPLQHQTGRANRGHIRSFSVILPGTVSKEYRIRVRHHIGAGEHE